MKSPTGGVVSPFYFFFENSNQRNSYLLLPALFRSFSLSHRFTVFHWIHIIFSIFLDTIFAKTFNTSRKEIGWECQKKIRQSTMSRENGARLSCFINRHTVHVHSCIKSTHYDSKFTHISHMSEISSK